MSHNAMGACAYLPRPVRLSMMLKTYMKRGFFPTGYMETRPCSRMAVAPQGEVIRIYNYVRVVRGGTD
jgi:hypothetical protein